MKLPLSWLSDYTDMNGITPKEYDAKLTMSGSKVEEVYYLGAEIDNVVTGKILEVVDHPDSDHLKICQLDVGKEEPVQIVTGAPNVTPASVGEICPVCLHKSTLPGGVKITKGKLRGVPSNGMMCSFQELGLSHGCVPYACENGILFLPAGTPVGEDIKKVLGLDDWVSDFEITSNRPDCLSVIGLARETAATFDRPFSVKTPEVKGVGDDINKYMSVEVKDTDLCPRYTARVIDNVKVGPSPEWLAERVTAAGGRSINSVVDVTNYILYLYGQPLHAFDFAKVASADGCAHIIVRAAADGEHLVTLDGEDRALTEDMTVIATPERAVALAGVMGGENSEVTEETTCVLLESAAFERGRTSRTSRNLGLISEASMRYERGVDDHLCEVVSQAAAALLAEVSGGTVRPGVVDVYELPTARPELIFRIPRFVAMMGADIPADFIEDILVRLGCAVEATDDPSVLSVLPPTFRPDLEREIDLYEEVLRLWGMDRIPPTLPGGRERVGARTPEQETVRVINDTLRASGMNETMTYSFAEPGDIERLRLPAEGLGLAVELLNPLNADMSVMRQSIVPGLLRSVAYNQARGVRNIQLYEIGTVFAAAEGRKKAKERKKLAGVLAGSMRDAAWNAPAVPFDFFDAKGVLENLARELALPKVRFRALSADEAPQLQPGRAAEMMANGAVVGWVGEVHPLVADAFGAEPPVVAFELDVAALVRACRPARDYVDVPTFPAVTVDQAFVVAEDVPHEKMVQVMTSAGGKLLESVALFDVYRDAERVGAGKKSMAYSLVYRAPDRTLTSEEVERAHGKLVSKVEKATGAEIRG